MGRKQVAYEYIKNAILTNQMLPETPVREIEIAEALQMSRTPIREAMRDLEAMGLLKSYPARGVFVTSITPYDVQEVCEIRRELELWAVERSYLQITNQELEETKSLFDKAIQAKDWEIEHQADRMLHRMITEKASNKWLMHFISILEIQTERIRRISAKCASRQDESYAEHLKIINALKEKDVEKAKKALGVHLASVEASAINASKLFYAQIGRQP